MINTMASLSPSRRSVSALPVSAFFMIFALSAASAAPPSISPNALRLLLLTKAADLAIIDVRPPDAYAKSHIQGAKNVPAAAVARAGLDRNAHIVVYCSEAVCPLSTGAANQLIANGYTKVELLEGGFGEWINKGYPVQSTAGTPVITPNHARTTAEDARAEMSAGTTLALDVRPANEFSAGHLPHARSAPLEQLDTEMLRLPKASKILVYDLSAARSRQAAEKLTAAGFNVSELSGGLAGWVKRGNTLAINE